MKFKAKPSFRTVSYAKDTGESILIASVKLSMSTLRRSNTEVTMKSSILKITHEKYTEYYVVPLWFIIYCKTFTLTRFQPLRLSWDFEI
jgi:hypothetical protein